MKKGAAAFRIPDDVIRLKKRIYEEIHKALNKKSQKIDLVFRASDRNKDSGIDINELKKLFADMQVRLTDIEI
jgi:Ca2+-binding EF-hand superfamily protein